MNEKIVQQRQLSGEQRLLCIILVIIKLARLKYIQVMQ